MEDTLDEPTNDPSELLAVADDLSLAFLVMLERLGPVERAVFLLRESFDLSYAEIASVVGKSEENCRQVDRRARLRLRSGGPVPRPVDREAHERLLSRFLEATRRGDVDGLVAVLAEDVVSYADGGGKVAACRPVSGAPEVARYLAGLVHLAPTGTEFRTARVNGQLGFLTYVDGRIRNVVSIYVEGDRIQRIFIVVNPDKLPGAR